MRKKANMYGLFLMIAVILAVLASIVLMYTKFQDYKDRVGTTQFYLMRSYENGENALYYIDSSFRASFLSSLYRGASSGFLYNQSCTDDPKNTDYYGFRKINTNEKSCLEKPSVNIKKELDSNIKKAFAAFSKTGIPSPGYGFYFLESKEGISAIGNQKKDLALEIMTSQKERCCEIKYSYGTSYIPIETGECKDYATIGTISSYGTTSKEVDLDKCAAEGDIVLSLADKKRVTQTIVASETESTTTTNTPIVNTVIQPSSGKCGFVADYAKRYIGCKYSLTNVALLSPENCNSVGLTCATFVASVAYSTLGSSGSVGGNGNQVCDSASVIKIGKDPKSLQPGDIFSAEYLRNDNTYSAWGHTGMYIGLGTLSQGESYWSSRICYRKFTPDPNGQPVFIHSIGSENWGPPGVCYESYTQLFKNSRFVLTSFCRPRKCN